MMFGEVVLGVKLPFVNRTDELKELEAAAGWRRSVLSRRHPDVTFEVLDASSLG